MAKGKKKMRGSVRAKAGLPAKAGRRKSPSKAGPHITYKEQRDRARWLSSLGVKPDKEKPPRR